VKLGEWWFLVVGIAIAAVVGLTLTLGGFRSRRAVRIFGDPERVLELRTFDASVRRGVKGVLMVLAVLLAFVAAARPQYGKGTRLIPATNLDVVIALDFSKSMYAQDVEPSRIFRAKVEIARLVKELRGARFGAVAFAGDGIEFPLSADGAAIAQFLRQLSPNDMPVGGTALARALNHARKVLERDPLSREHKRIIVLVTDGEDLEGNPVAVAKNLGAEGTTVHVVQIGGRTPERIPEIGDDGRVVGWRSDAQGRPLMTQLSPEGEEQLAAIAAATPDGKLVRAEKGSTGIEEITTELKRQMKGELAERVEHVYAEVYFWPLIAALLLLLAEIFVSEAPRRLFKRPAPPPPRVSPLRVTKSGKRPPSGIDTRGPSPPAPSPPLYATPVAPPTEVPHGEH
jgi:Ca-activated chloride channel family protein